MGTYDIQNLSPDNMLVRNLALIGIELVLPTLIYAGDSVLLWFITKRVNRYSRQKLIRVGCACAW